jgi:lipopolysaccharide/colanic/teichoic acid biosynthesis glycosyltransferase/glycosyltransferase involved in cell wall biosynthesis
MKVMLVITKGETGGAQTHVLALCRALAGQVQFVAAIGGAEPTTPLGDGLEAMGIEVCPLPQLGNSLSPPRLIAAVRALLRLLRQHQPDVVHAHSAMAGVVARIAGRIVNLPVIYTVHGFGFKPEVPRLQRWVAWLTEFALAPFTSHMVCVSEYERKLAARLPISSDRVSVIFNAVTDTPTIGQPAQEPVRIVMVARMASPKRPDLLLHALALLRDRLGYEVPASLIGDGPDLKVHQDLCQHLGLQAVTFTGNVTNVSQRLAEHAIFVLMSDHEGLPISVIEAMHAGLAVVASDLPGLRELIVDETHGLLVPNQALALADSLFRLVTSGELRLRLGRAARQRVEDQFTPVRMVEPVAARYAELAYPPPRLLANLYSYSTLASTTARQQKLQLYWSLSGLLVLLLSYLIAAGLQQANVVTYQFPQTVLWCGLPYLLAAHWLYRGVGLPAAERAGLLLVTTATPFLLMPLGFAMLQQPYSRGAVLLVYALSTSWFVIGNWLHWRRHVQRLAYFDQGIPGQLKTLIGSASVGSHSVRLVPWPEAALALGQIPACEGVVLDRHVASSDVRSKLLSSLKFNHVRLYSVEAVAELLSGRKMPPTDQDDLWQMDGNPAYDVAKRAIDVVLVLVCLPLWLPLCALLAMLVKLDSPGPALFTQSRVGRDGHSFRLWKFRSMRHIKQPQPARFAQQQDARVTRVGRIIRRWRLDELPQLWNVLWGHMSLIGPRPEQAEFVEAFATRIPAYTYRHLVRPGLTGWAQMQQGYADSEEETVVKLSYDLYYVAHYSMALDLLIAYKTVRTVLNGFGSR